MAKLHDFSAPNAPMMAYMAQHHLLMLQSIKSSLPGVSDFLTFSLVNGNRKHVTSIAGATTHLHESGFNQLLHGSLCLCSISQNLWEFCLRCLRSCEVLSKASAVSFELAQSGSVASRSTSHDLIRHRGVLEGVTQLHWAAVACWFKDRARSKRGQVYFWFKLGCHSARGKAQPTSSFCA